MKAETKVSRTPDSSELREAEQALLAEGAARASLETLLGFVRSDAQALELHMVERELFRGVLTLGRRLLALFLAEKGTGKVPEGRATAPWGEELPYHSVKTKKDYLSIFGEVPVRRAYYWEAGAAKGWCPLDAELNLPAQRHSYLLQEWGELLGVENSFEQVTKRLDEFFGVKFWTQSVQAVARTASADVQAFYEQKAPPDVKAEGEFLVATIDGKGVPVRPLEPRGRKLRIAKGEKPNKKKEAVVSAVYTVDPHVRTAEDVIREIDDQGCILAPDPPPPPRPRPQGKRLRGTLLGKDAAFAEVRRQLDERDPEGRKQRLALTDGAGPLQDRVLSELKGAGGIVLILDVMHVLTYLWNVATLDHEEGSVEASRWVMNKLRLVLEGKVGYVIGGLRRRLAEGGFSNWYKKKLEQAIRYMDRNRAYMRYDEYLANGYPIASGIAEGACKNLVKDRMERTGMRWTVEGAEAMLELRAVELNNDWREFWRFHAARQREQLYGPQAGKGGSRAA